MLNIDVNFMAIVFAGVAAAMVFGAVWYAPGVFGRAWMKLAGLGPSAEKGMGKRLLITFFAHSATATTLFTILMWAGANSVVDGLLLGLWLGFGLTCMALLVPHLWEGRPVRLFAITAGCGVCTVVLMCTLMASLIGRFGLKAF